MVYNANLYFVLAKKVMTNTNIYLHSIHTDILYQHMIFFFFFVLSSFLKILDAIRFVLKQQLKIWNFLWYILIINHILFTRREQFILQVRGIKYGYIKYYLWIRFVSTDFWNLNVPLWIHWKLVVYFLMYSKVLKIILS